MVNIFTMYNHILHGIMKVSGVRTQAVEIEPGTVMNFWTTSKIPKKIKANMKSKPKKSKPAVVLLHGFGMDGILTWQFQVLGLAKSHAVYVPDFLFFGASTTDKLERSATFQAECVAEGLRRLGVEKCTLVGWSYGGFIGFKMAELYPDLVESLVVSGTDIALTRSISDEALARVGFECWSEGLLPDTVERVKYMNQLASHKSGNLPNWFYKDCLEVTFKNKKQKAELLEALIVEDKGYNIPAFTQRVHLLWAEEDKIWPMETARKIKKQLGEGTTLQSIENACHLAQLEQPCVYNRHLRKILASSSSLTEN